MAKFNLVNEHTRHVCQDFIENLSMDYQWECEIKRKVKKRSNSQNNLMWMWLSDIAGHVKDVTGYETNEVHELFKDMFLDQKVIEIAGHSTETSTTTTLSPKEMMEYMDSISRFCSQDLGIFLPYPEDLQRR